MNTETFRRMVVGCFPMAAGSACTLQPLQPDAADPLFALVAQNRIYLRAWLPWVDATRQIEDTQSFLRLAAADCSEAKALHCGLWHAGTLCGVIGFHTFDWSNRKTSLGYWLGQSWEGRGIMTAACRVFMAWAFRQLQLHRVEIRCAVQNVRSCAVAGRLGARFEGTLRAAEWVGDHYKDQKVFSVLSTDQTTP